MSLLTLPLFFKHRFFVQHRSCVCSVIGNRSLGFTLLFLPAKALQRPGIYRFSHSSLRKPNGCPNQFLAPLVLSLNCYEYYYDRRQA